MRTRPLLLSVLFLTAALATAQSQPAPQPATVPADSAPASGDKSAAPATAPAPAVAAPAPAPAAPADTTVIKDGEPAHAAITAKTKDATGKDTLSVDFPDTDIRDILRNVADLFELNLFMPDTLQGKASIKLRDVTWRQIFEIVLKPVGYTFVEQNNIVKIVSLNDLQNEPFTTKSFGFENVTSAKIMPLITPMLTPKRDATPALPAQQGGSIVNSELSNELIITDQSTVLARIGEMVKRLDAEPKQVVIETKFVEISKDDSKNREIAFGYNRTTSGLQAGTGLASGANSLLSFPFTLGEGAFSGGAPTVVFNQREFSALLNVLNSSNDVRLVTNPTIVAINGSKSEIKIGRELQLVTITTTTSGSTPVTTATAGDIKFVGITLEVTPQITGSKLIALKVKPVKSSVFNTTQVDGNTFYDIDKREGDLNIILRDGQTAAIGGLVDTTETVKENKVPLLGDIPLLGNLFKSNGKELTETNLVIFITASVLEPTKMKYENVVSKDQLNTLELTQRDILGKRYNVSDEEASLQQQLDALRQKRQDAEAMDTINKEITPPAKK